MAFITFVIGFFCGLLAAQWYASAVVHAETPVQVPPVAPGPYSVVLLGRHDEIRATQTMAHLPRTIYRQRGKLASDIYTYEGVDSNGTHRFRMVLNGGH